MTANYTFYVSADDKAAVYVSALPRSESEAELTKLSSVSSYGRSTYAADPGTFAVFYEAASQRHASTDR